MDNNLNTGFGVVFFSLAQSCALEQLNDFANRPL